MTRIIIYINILFLSLGATSLSSQIPAEREYKVKAAFLFHLAQFVEWPSNAFSEANSPLIIGILGDNPFGVYLDELVYGEDINGHPLLIQHYQTAEEATTCHILFINLTDKKTIKEAVAALKGRSILTVSDNSDFIDQGGMVNLVKKNSKIRIVINTASTKEDDLKISSKLLAIANVVH